MRSDIPDPPLELLDYISGVPDVARTRAVADFYLKIFIETGKLSSRDRVLDVGCGVGRIAQALAGHLEPTARYEGFDISRAAIDWCRENITPRHPNFRFEHADVYNEFYNPAGRSRARLHRFPYADSSFDFVFLTSVFTHMMPHDLRQYLAEISRVLAPGGRCVITFFLHNDATAEAIRAGRSAFQLPHRYGKPSRAVGSGPEYGDCLTESDVEVERVVAYEENWVKDQLASCGLTPDSQHLVGHWSGRTGPGFQDIVAATKTGPVSLRFRLSRGLRFDGLREHLWRARLRLNRLRAPAAR